MLMKVRVRAPEPGTEDGFEVVSFGYADGHVEEPRKCNCGFKEPEKYEDDPLSQPCTHADSCPMMGRRLTDLEWLEEELQHCGDVARYLWGGEERPSSEPEFTVLGTVWAYQDYWGEWDGGFEFERIEEG